METSPPAKKKKTSEDNLITYRVQNVSKIAGDWSFHSSDKRIGHFPWHISVTTKDDKDVVVFLFCAKDVESNVWFARVNVDFVLVNQYDEAKSLKSKQKEYCFDWKSTTTSRCCSKTWSKAQVVDPEKGFIKNDALVFEVRVTTIGAKGSTFRLRNKFGHFDEPTATSRTLLRIDGCKFYVSKQIIATHSPVFNTFFYSKAKGHDAIETEFEGLDPGVFEKLLRAMYRIGEQFEEDSLEDLLKMAQLFKMEGLFDEADRVLPIMKIDQDTKLNLADKYRLPNLMDHVLSEYTLYSMNELKESDRYRSFRDSTRARIHERVIELEKKEKKEQKCQEWIGNEHCGSCECWKDHMDDMTDEDSE